MFSLVNSAVNVTLPAFAAERRATAPSLLGDRYVLPAKHSAANPPHAAAAVERWDRRTDGRPIVTDTAPHTMQAVSIRWNIIT